jgi:hypothetical protein
VKQAAALLVLAAACAHAPASPKTPSVQVSRIGQGVEVEDAVHGVRYELPAAADPWQVTREGNAHSATGVEAEVSSFPLATPAAPAGCRDHARQRLNVKRESSSGDVPRDQASGEAPAPNWSFTSGPAATPARNRWAFYSRGADCLVLRVSGARDDAFAGETFERAARTFEVLPLSLQRQQEVDLLAGMGFLERRDPGAALERFEALSKREPDLAKAHFGVLMAGFELGPAAYARALPHGEAALKAERELTPEQRQLALRAVGVMQLAENHVKNAADTLSELVVRAPDLAEGHYNYACALARLGDLQGALDHLRAALRLEGELVEHARGDDDLKSLRDKPAFQQLLRSPPKY